MGAKKKEPINILNRNSKRYSLFDADDISILEKELTFFNFIEDHEKEELVALKQDVEFINPQNYDNFIDDVTRLLKIAINHSNKDKINITEIINNIHNLNWDVKAIENYLESIELSKGNTALSFIHMQNFTETIVRYPYPLEERSIYQKHITPLIEIDFKQDLADIQKYVARLYDSLKIKRNPYESNKKLQFIKRTDFNFGDCLFTYDALINNYSLLNIQETINYYRYDKFSIDTESITQK